jgi:hypothetical protein
MADNNCMYNSEDVAAHERILYTVLRSNGQPIDRLILDGKILSLHDNFHGQRVFQIAGLEKRIATSLTDGKMILFQEVQGIFERYGKQPQEDDYLFILYGTADNLSITLNPISRIQEISAQVIDATKIALELGKHNLYKN